MNILIVDDEVSALRDLERTLKKTVQDAEITKADRAETALSLCREQEFDVAFLDIRMPGKDGLELAREMKKIRPLMNIIMVTAYQQYVYDAVKLYVSDYILKPARAEDIRNALANLRHPVREERKGLYVHCFGNFEVFYDGEAVRFGRAKVKELFAYLIDRKGASASNAEIRAALWGDEVTDDRKQRTYFSQIVHGLRTKLEELGCGEVFVQSRDSYAVATEKIPCDYYMALKGDAQVLARYEGEYMQQYEWANLRVGAVNRDLGIDF